MRTLRTCLVSIGLASCGGEATGPNAPPPPPAPPRDAVTLDDGLARLVPADAAALVYVPSLQGVIQDVRGMVAAVQPGREGIVDLSLIEPLLGGLRVTDLDTTKPAAIAFRLVNDEPTPILIMPVTDVEGARDIADVEIATADDWIALSADAGPIVAGNKAPTLAVGMPKGSVSMRVDLERFDAALATAERTLMQGLRRAGPSGESAIAVYEWLFRVLREDGRYLDLATTMDGGILGMTASLDTGKPGPVVAGRGNLADVIRRVRGDAGSIAFVMNGDLSSFMDGLEPLIDSMTANAPPEQQQQMRQMLGAQRGLYGALAGPSAGRFGIGENGMHGVFVSKPADIELAMREISAFGEASAGFYAVDPASVTTTTIGDVEFRKVTASTEAMANYAGVADPQAAEQTKAIIESMYGEALVVHNGAVDGYVLTAMSYDDEQLGAAVEAVRAADAKHPTLTADLAKLSAEPYFFMTMDLGELTGPMLAAMPPGIPLPEFPADANIRMWFGMTEHQGRHAVEFSIDVGAIAQLFR